MPKLKRKIKIMADKMGMSLQKTGRNIMNGVMKTQGKVYNAGAGGYVRDIQPRLPINGSLTRSQMQKRFPKG